jgi:hypothetical protein
VSIFHLLEEMSPRRRFDVVELRPSYDLRIDESLVVRSTKIGEDGEGFDVRALCGKRAPDVVRW